MSARDSAESDAAVHWYDPVIGHALHALARPLGSHFTDDLARVTCEVCRQVMVDAVRADNARRRAETIDVVDGRTDRCPTPGYAGNHTAVGAGAVSSPYHCHGCGAWFTIPDTTVTLPGAPS